MIWTWCSLRQHVELYFLSVAFFIIMMHSMVPISYCHYHLMLMFCDEYNNCFYDILFEKTLETWNHAITFSMIGILISFTLSTWIFDSYPIVLDSNILF